MNGGHERVLRVVYELDCGSGKEDGHGGGASPKKQDFDCSSFGGEVDKEKGRGKRDTPKLVNPPR